MNKTTRNLMIAFGAVTGLLLVGAVIAAGFMQRSLWSILLLAAVFTVLYIYGKQPHWKTLISEKPGMVVPNLLGTYATQTVMCGIFYLIGFGAKALLGETGDRAPFSMFDYQFAGGLLLLGLILGTIVNQFSKRVFADLSSLLEETRAQLDDAQATLGTFTGAGRDENTADIRLLDKPVTPSSLIAGVHFSHGEYKEDGFDGTPNAKSAGGEDKIAEAEKRLGRELPERLKEIYRIYNGGSINEVCVVKDGVTGTELKFDDVLMPFSGYNDLYPLERLYTAWESFEHFANPEDPDDMEEYGELFSHGTENMVLLAQWYQESLFLDYNQSGEPRVGFVDFDNRAWWEVVRYWPNFAAFFADLRHYEDID